jgi:ADP-heptose:LPS heptosyltransferase
VSASDLKSRDFQNILPIKLSAIGDDVHTISVLNKLRRRYPRARIDWLTTPTGKVALINYVAVHNLGRPA